MKISRNLLLLSILLVIGTAESSFSDSDGYFCVGPGYLAYELNDTSAPASGHVLNIIYLGGEAGISAPVKVMLESFQTHGMKCGENSIEILAWDAIHSEAKNGGGIIYRHTKTEVVQKYPHGEIVKRLEIFEGTFEKTID